VSRRGFFAIALVLSLIGGRLFVSRAIRPVAAAHYGAVLPSPEVKAVSPATKAESYKAAPEAVGAPVEGVTDVDPHKAFGSKSAPITMEVFSDYQCPSCRALFLGTNRQLMDNYVTTGKVYLIHRDFPLPMHAYSRVAARYARAAAEIGKIEPVERVLYENQDKWEQSGDVDAILAGVLSASDMAKVRALVKGGTLDPLIEKDLQLGQMYRINQTPTTVFHSKGQTYPYSGAMGYETLRQFLDQLLSQK
jgi:protein-disulfide isomerase